MVLPLRVANGTKVTGRNYVDQKLPNLRCEIESQPAEWSLISAPPTMMSPASPRDLAVKLDQAIGHFSARSVVQVHRSHHQPIGNDHGTDDYRFEQLGNHVLSLSVMNSRQSEILRRHTSKFHGRARSECHHQEKRRSLPSVFLMSGIK